MTIVAIAIFFLFAILGMPLAFAMATAVFGGMYYQGLSPEFAVTRMVHSVDSFPLMAIPLFAMAGQLLVKGGVVDPLIGLCNAMIGRIKGGLGHVTVMSAMGLSAVSGSAVADAAALGGILGPTLTKYYTRGFGAALVSSASCMGPVIPPSVGMIVYAVVVSDVSIAALFMAGVVPGIVMGLGLMAMCTYLAHRRDWPLTGEPFTLSRFLSAFRQAWLILLMPIIVIGGIMFGVFTATEGAAVAVAYAVLAGLFVTRRLRLADIPEALIAAALITAVVGILISFSSGITFMFTLERVGESVANLMSNHLDTSTMCILVAMVIVLVLGMFIEGNSLIIMLAPILGPIAVSYGIDPVYFAFLFVMNVALGSITPPVGILLFVTGAIWKVEFNEIVRNIWPFIFLLYGVLLVMVAFPGLVIALPRALGIMP